MKAESGLTVAGVSGLVVKFPSDFEEFRKSLVPFLAEDETACSFPYLFSFLKANFELGRIERSRNQLSKFVGITILALDGFWCSNSNTVLPSAPVSG